MFTLRDYQLENVLEVAHAVHNYKRIINCIATGGGKTKIAISITNRALIKGKTVLFITESDKIYKQLDAEITDTTNINSTAKLSYLAPNRLYLAMAQTLARRAELIKQFAAMGNSLLIINDEAHVGTGTKLLLQLPHALLIGLTATPAMKWAKHLPTLYNSIVVGKQPEWLVAKNYLVKYQHAQVTAANLNSLQIKAGEFTEESQERIFDTVNSHQFVLQHLRQYRYTKCMIFCASIKSAESLHSYLTTQGHKVCTQHSKYEIRSESVQAYELAQFTNLNSGVNICISIASMNKGFDFPPVDLILLYRATTSLPLYLQMCGRASRTSPDTGKAMWTVLDYGGNGKRHGRWDYPCINGEPVDWNVVWNTIPKKREGVAPIKECPKCKYLLPILAQECSNCGHVFVKTKEPKHIDDVHIVMLEQQNAQLREMKGKRISQLTPIELANYAKIKGKKPYAARVAKALTLTTPTYIYEYAKAMGYKNGWADFNAPSYGERIDFFDKIV
jgi:superfamily II DNA or RNA helicase